jgi:hypothetical protein
VDPEHIAEVNRIMGIKPKASPYAHLAEIYAIGSEEEEKMTPHLSCEINEVKCNALCDIVKDRYGEPERGGSKWEPIKILLEGDGNSIKMNTASNTRL